MFDDFEQEYPNEFVDSLVDEILCAREAEGRAFLCRGESGFLRSGGCQEKDVHATSLPAESPLKNLATMSLALLSQV